MRTQQTHAAGIELEDGLARLRATVGRVCWPWPSAYMWGVAAEVFPRVCLHDEGAPMRHRVDEPGDGAVVACGMAPTADIDVWAARLGVRLLAPSPAAYTWLSRKEHVDELARGLAISTPRSQVLEPEDVDTVRRYLHEGGGRCVMQRLDDGRSGAGTRLLRSVDEFVVARDEFGDRAYKLAELVPGLSCTVSGYVAADATGITTVTQQLVQSSGERFGRHFGNQILVPGDVDPATERALRGAAALIAERLRARGLRGAFGLDVVVNGSTVVLIEVNPRLQSTSSLGAWQEWESGLLPGPLSHVLAHVDPTVRFTPARLADLPLSQAQIRADKAGRVANALSDGLYAVTDRGLAHMSGRPSDFRSVSRDGDHVWIWNATPQPGAHVAAGDLVAIVQSWRKQFTLSAAPRPTSHGLEVRDAVLSRLLGAPPRRERS